MRGKASEQFQTVFTVGITPAHAGKSYDERYEKSLGKDHPRTCGEKKGKHNSSNCIGGSPPHMRGKA